MNDRFSTAAPELRQYAWNYFQLHAEQRLKTFEFYIMLSTATVGGYVALLQVTNSGSIWTGAVGLAISFFAFVFWKLDIRTRNLIKNAERALAYLDSLNAEWIGESEDSPILLIRRDDEHTSAAKKYPLSSGHYSYSRCFEWVFLAFGIAGIIFFLCSMIRMALI